MSKKKPRKPPVQAAVSSSSSASPATTPAISPSTHAPGLPAEMGAGDWTAVLLALMLFLAPALGVPNEEMLQDTLKSIVVSGMALLALLAFFWHQRARSMPLRWHGLMWLPLALAAYALGSMAWSHAFLGGVEAIRWLVFAIILWLGLNSFSRERFTLLAAGIHAGALVASLWTALQFWADFKGFPQGPNPASTFVNRNFFAEFAVCTLPFSLWLLLRLRGPVAVALMSFTVGFNLVAIFMTGTRSALISLGAMALLLPLLGWYQRNRWSTAASPAQAWSRMERLVAVAVMAVTVVGLGSVPTGNAALITENQLEGRGVTALERSFVRALSMTDRREYTERSFSLRWVMWSATGRMIAARPLSGVGAGAWEVDIPLYQSSGAQLETDYYVHNEILQLLAEYGLVGWAFLLALLGYLVQAAWRTVRDRSAEMASEAPLRATTLLSLLLFLIVSNAGFPWRLAATGALFAVGLAILAASDVRLATHEAVRSWGLPWAGPWARALPWTPSRSLLMLGASTLGLLLCLFISQRAIEAESKIVRAVKLALTITASRQPNHPRWEDSKKEMFQLLREGVAINRHYRKLTPMVADEVAKWGDWKDAVWIWESVAQSRPYVVAIMSNVARGYSLSGQYDKAMYYLERCKKLQPNAPSVRSLEVILLARTGHTAESMALIRRSLAENIIDYDLASAAIALGEEQKDWDMALAGFALRGKNWPDTAVDSWLKSGLIYADGQNPKHDGTKALEAFRQAIELAKPQDKAAVRAEIPVLYQGLLASPAASGR